MKKNNTGLTREESIRLEAYLLSEKAGHPTGMERYFWMQAEAIVQKRSTSALPEEKPAPAAPKSRAKKPVAATAKPKAAAAPKVTKAATAKAVKPAAPETPAAPKRKKIAAAKKQSLQKELPIGR